MSGIVNSYDGSILFERVLKANLPTKTSGKKIFFVVNKPTDTVGEIWATNNEGVVVCYSVAVDVQTLNTEIASVKKELNNLSKVDAELQKQINVLSNPNLLINGDFQVWQRGGRFSGGGYTADRWKYQTNSPVENAICERVNNGFKLTTHSANYVYHIVQVLETDYAKKLTGKTVTLTAKINSNVPDDNVNVEVWSDIKGYGHCKRKGDVFTGIFNIDVVGNTFGVTFGINNAVGSIIVEWVKLEMGDRATPFIPRHYAEELALCQRYYEIVESIVIIGDKTDSTNKNICCSIPFKAEKRIIPTIAYTNPANVSYVGFVDIENLGVIDNNKHCLNPLVGISLQGLQYSGVQPVIIRATADAEIY